MRNPFDNFQPAPRPERQAEAQTIGSFFENAGNSFTYALLYSPYNAAAQTVNHIRGQEVMSMVEPPRPAQPYTSDWVAQQIGGGVGMALPFVAVGALGRLGQARGLLAETGAASLRNHMFMGAVYGGLLSPVDERGNFLEQKATHALSGALSFGAMERIGAGLRVVGQSKVPCLSRMMRYEVPNHLASGAGVGFANADIHSYVHHGRAATWDERLQSAVSFTLLNGAMLGGRRFMDFRLSTRPQAQEQQQPCLAVGTRDTVFSAQRTQARAQEGRQLRIIDADVLPDAAPESMPESGPMSLATRQRLLEVGNFELIGPRVVDQFGHEVLVGRVRGPQGELEVVVSEPRDARQARKADFARQLNSRMGLGEHDLPATERTIDIGGEPQKRWLQELAARNLEDYLCGLARSRYGSDSPANIVRVLQEDPRLWAALETALADRFRVGCQDINPYNVVVNLGPGGEFLGLSNVNYGTAFGLAPRPKWSITSQIGTMQQVCATLGGSRLSPELVDAMATFISSRRALQEILGVGVKEGPAEAFLQRSRSLIEDGIPRDNWISRLSDGTF